MVKDIEKEIEEILREKAEEDDVTVEEAVKAALKKADGDIEIHIENDGEDAHTIMSIHANGAAMVVAAWNLLHKAARISDVDFSQFWVMLMELEQTVGMEEETDE